MAAKGSRRDSELAKEYGQINAPRHEEMFIAACLKDLAIVRQYLGIMDPDAFTEGNLAWLWANLCKQAGDSDRKLPNLAELMEVVKKDGLLVATIEALIEKLKKKVTEGDDVNDAADIVIRTAQHRKLWRLYRDAQSQLVDYTDQETIANVANDVLVNTTRVLVGHGSDAKPVLLGSFAEEALERLADDRPLMYYYSTGFPCLDKALGGGLSVGSLTYFAARAKTGKSMFLHNLAYNLARTGTPVLYLDTEMSSSEQLLRLLARQTGIEMDSLKNGAAYLTDKHKVLIKELPGLPMYWLRICGMSFEAAMAIVRRWYFTINKRRAVLVFDYLKMSTGDRLKEFTEWQLLGLKSTGLKDLAEELPGLSVASALQMNRQGVVRENQDIIEDESIVAASDRISWFCDNLVGLRKKTVKEMDRDGPDAGNVKASAFLVRNGAGHGVVRIGDSEKYERDAVCFEIDYSRNMVTEKGDLMSLVFPSIENVEETHQPIDSTPSTLINPDDLSIFDQ